ncbi:hypothetical protein K439DRAFT_312352 [Ramaria rubella]|nr:hypothetical protein K439DRAFT_312352 [Ramaria rubella]
MFSYLFICVVSAIAFIVSLNPIFWPLLLSGTAPLSRLTPQVVYCFFPRGLQYNATYGRIMSAPCRWCHDIDDNIQYRPALELIISKRTGCRQRVLDTFFFACVSSQ